MFRDSPVSYIPIREPFFASIGTVAASPSLQADFIPAIAARRIEPASVRVAVQDAEGKALPAAIEIDRPLDGAILSGSTDDRGEMQFTGLFASGDLRRSRLPRDLRW